MKTFSCFFLLCVSFSGVAQTVANNEAIKIKAIPHTAVVVDGPSEIKILSDNTITMSAGKETDLHNPASGSYERHNAPKFLFTPDKNFDFSARVNLTFEKLYDGGAILIYSDRENWSKILLENIDNRAVLGISVVRNKITDDAYFFPTGTEIYLRVTKVDKVFNYYYSPDGKQWTQVREFVYHKPENMRIGFYTQSPVGAGCKVEFSEIKYTATK